MPEPPAIHRKRYQGTEISLSSAALIDLLSAVHEKGADFRFRASGMSMHPAIREGDVITLSPMKGMKPILYDVIAFRHPDTGKLIVHRIIVVSTEYLQAKGDNGPETDGLIPTSNVLGLVTKVERNGSPVFWPDSRRFPRGARIYFKTYYCLLVTKKKLYSICVLTINKLQKSKRSMR